MHLPLCLLSLLICSALAFKHQSLSRCRSSSLHIPKAVLTPGSVDDTDSSQMEFTSSADLRRKREADEKKQISAILKRSRELHVECEKSFAVKNIPPPPTPKPVAAIVTAVTPVSTAVVTKGAVAAEPKTIDMLSNLGGGFDIGLYLAFPVMIATLAFFFLFPFLRDSIGPSLPPVPLS